jgi:diamine N-acetyltransferase
MSNQPSLHIRHANVADLKIIQDVGCDTYRHHFSSAWSKQGIENFLQQEFSAQTLCKSLHLPADHSWLLAEDIDGLVIGYAKIN